MKTMKEWLIWFFIILGPLSLSTVLGWSDTLKTSTPAGTDDPREADDRMRETKAAFVERLDIDHYFAASATSTYDATDTGKHRYVTFREPNDLTSMSADESALFSKDANSLTELHWIDESDNVVQLTSGGYIYGNNLKAGSVLTAAIADANVTVAKMFYKDEDDMASDSATHVATQQSIKAYIDDAQKPTGRLHLASNQLNLVNGTSTKVALATISTGFSDSIEDTGNNKITPAVAGYYLVCGSVNFANAIADKYYEAKVRKNGSSDICQTTIFPSANGSPTAFICDIVYLDADDYVQLYAISNSGDNTVDIYGGSSRTYLSLQRLR